MVIAALVFGLAILSFSILFLLRYIQNDKYMRASRDSLTRLRQQQLKSEIDLRAQIDADTRLLEEARRRLRQRSGDDNAAAHR